MDTTIAFPTTAASADAAAVTDRERIEALFDAQGRRLFALALRMTGHRADALDLLQETFVRALEHARSLPDSTTGAEAWLVRVLVNLIRDRGRRRKVRGVAAELPAALAASGRPEPAALARIQVRQALAGIPPRRRAILVMSEIEGRTSIEIGRLLGLRPATVRWHRARARETLRARLQNGIGAGTAGDDS